MLGQFGRSASFSRTMGANVGSTATGTAANIAEKTAISGVTDRPNQRALGAIESAGSQGSSIHPGSRAGLKDGSTVHLQSNTEGYANQRNHTARMNPSRPSEKPIIPAANNSLRTSGRTFDKRLTASSSSSISRLSKLTK